MKFTFKSLHLTFPGILLSTLVAVNLLVIFLPLLGTLGYENAALNSFLVFIMGGFYSIYFYRNKLENTAKPFEIIADSKKQLASFLLIPLVVPLIPSLLFSKCPITDGIVFYLLLTVPSLFLGFAAGYFSSVLSKRLSYLIFFSIAILLISESLVEFYFNPQVYFFNPLIGFTPGTIYDEELKVDSHLMIYRLLNILFASVVILISVKVVSKKIIVRIAFAFGVVACAILFYFAKPVLGYSTNLSRMENNLNSSIRTKHFIIDYSQPKEYFTTPSLIGLLHEYYFEQVETELEIKPGYKVRSFLFKDRNQKKDIFGTANADISKPWLHEIFINYNSFELSLKHELVHTLASSFGVAPLEVADDFNTAMIEGIATAVDNNFDGYSVHYAAKLAYEAGYKVNIPDLFSGLNFFTQFSSVSYIYAGSFIKFLIARYGIEKIEVLYTNLDFKLVTGKNIDDLSKDYNNFLKSLKIDFNKNKAQLYFAGQPIFKKFCPRSAASQIKEASRLFESKKYTEALNIFSQVYEYSGSYESLSGQIHCMIKLKKVKDAENLISSEIRKFKGSRFYFQLELALADVFVREDRHKDALVLYDSLLIQQPHIAYTNSALIREAFYKIDSDTLKRFINAETKEQFSMLLGLNKKSIQYFTVPTLFDLCKDTNQVRLICRHFKNAAAKDYISSYALLLLSKAAIILYDFNLAEQFAVEAIKYKDNPDFNYTLIENLKKVNWLKNFSSELKPFFVYQ